MMSSKRFMVTYVIIAVNVAAYVYTSIIGGDFVITGDYPIMLYGQVNYLVAQGWYWQLFTSMFVHANITHLLGNMFFLLIFGLRAEDLLSVQEYGSIYLLSGLTGNLLTLLLGPSTISVGASGAIFGLFGAVAIYMRRAVGQSIIGALLYAFFLFIINVGAGVNILAHLGGLVTGLLIGYLLAARRHPKQRVVYRYNYTYST